MSAARPPSLAGVPLCCRLKVRLITLPRAFAGSRQACGPSRRAPRPCTPHSHLRQHAGVVRRRAGALPAAQRTEQPRQATAMPARQWSGRGPLANRLGRCPRTLQTRGGGAWRRCVMWRRIRATAGDQHCCHSLLCSCEATCGHGRRTGAAAHAPPPPPAAQILPLLKSRAGWTSPACTHTRRGRPSWLASPKARQLLTLQPLRCTSRRRMMPWVRAKAAAAPAEQPSLPTNPVALLPCPCPSRPPHAPLSTSPPHLQSPTQRSSCPLLPTSSGSNGWRLNSPPITSRPPCSATARRARSSPWPRETAVAAARRLRRRQRRRRCSQRFRCGLGRAGPSSTRLPRCWAAWLERACSLACQAGQRW